MRNQNKQDYERQFWFIVRATWSQIKHFEQQGQFNIMFAKLTFFLFLKANENEVNYIFAYFRNHNKVSYSTVFILLQL